MWLEEASTLNLSHFCLLIDQPPVSQTFTAPFDRLRIFLITRPSVTVGSRSFGMKVVTDALTQICVENGVLGFWIRNELSVALQRSFPSLPSNSFVRVLRTASPPLDGRLLTLGMTIRNECLPHTGTTSRTPVRLAGPVDSCRVVSVVSQVDLVCNRSVDVNGVHELILGQADTRLKP